MTANLRVGVLLFMVLLVIAMWVAAFASKQQEKASAGVVPLDPFHFEALTLVTAGTGGTFENHWRRGPALVVGLNEDAVLIDAGRGVSEALRAAQIPADQPRVVLLSNLAPESVLGLDELWLDAWLRSPAEPLQIYGPPGTEAFVSGLQRAYAPQQQILIEAWTPPLRGGEIEVTEVSGGESFRVGVLEVRSAAIDGAAVPSLGWRIEAGDRAIAVAVSGSDEEQIVALGKGAHVLVLEGVFGASLDLAREAEVEGLDQLVREAAGHLRLEDAGRVGREAQAHSIVLTRLRPPPVFDFQFENLVGESYRGGPVIIAEDGESITP